MKLHETLPLVPIARGEGAWLYDFDGRRYLDAVSSWWVNLFGHANPRINAALAAQLGRARARDARRLHAPAGGRALRAARRAGAARASATRSTAPTARRRPRSRSRWRSTTGRTAAGPDKTALRLARRRLSRRDARRARGDRRADLPRHLRAAAPPQHDRAVARRARRGAGRIARATSPRAPRAALEAHLAAHHATIAAFIVEPLVQGASGMAMHDPHYLARARELCTRYDVLLIADEIMTGFGRTGTLFACEQAGIAPDFLCLSKGITGGYLPLSCVLSTDAIYDAFYADDARARLPALAFVHRQRARLPRRARGARHLPRRRRDRARIAPRPRAGRRSRRRSPRIRRSAISAIAA